MVAFCVFYWVTGGVGFEATGSSIQLSSTLGSYLVVCVVGWTGAVITGSVTTVYFTYWTTYFVYCTLFCFGVLCYFLGVSLTVLTTASCRAVAATTVFNKSSLV